MAINPDPKPGRWLLPLVVLGMMLFTFVFVSRLPGSEPAATTSPTSPTDSTQPSGSSTPDTTTGTTLPADPALTAYREAITPLGTQMSSLQTEMATVNAGWDADPKQLTAAETQTRLTAVRDQAAALAAALGQITPPVGLETQHATLADAANRAAAEANNTLSGFTSAPGPEQRRAGAVAFDAAATDFLAALATI